MGRVVTIHNNPENMQLPGRFKHLRLQLADVDTQDVSKFFAPSYTFIEEARAANEGAHLETDILPTPLSRTVNGMLSAASSFW